VLFNTATIPHMFYSILCDRF